MMKIYKAIVALTAFTLLFIPSVLGQTDFGLYPSEKQFEDKRVGKQVLGFLKNIEKEVADGIRFGTNKLYQVEFTNDFAIDFENLACDGTDKLVEINGENLTLPKTALIQLVQYQSHNRNGKGCSLNKAIAKSIEVELLKDEENIDLSIEWTKQENNDLSICRSVRKRKGRSAFRFNPSFKKKCDELEDLAERKRKMKRYNHKIKNLLYRANMEFDATSFGDQNLEKYGICKRDYKPTKILKSGKKMKMLGMALVYMAPGYTTSVMGHMAERYVYCLDDRLVDVLFEFTQLTEGEVDHMKDTYKKYLDGASDEYIKSLVGQIYMKYQRNPANSRLGGYGFYSFYTNRDILEVWPKVTESEIYNGLQDSLGMWKTQREQFKKREIFPDYDLFKNNCTHPVREKLNSWSGDYDINNWEGLTPINIFGFLKNKKSDKMIMYPSQRLLRQFNMFEKGKSLFWENTTFWSQASEGYGGRGHLSSMILYPETHGFLKRLIINPTYGAVNLGAATVQALYGIITAPLRWLSKIPGLGFLKPKKSEIALQAGLMGIGMSLPEIIGVRMRYPKPAPWTDEELDFMYDELPYHQPKVLDYLLDRVNQ
ncbi:MAG: hypothetical protein GY909_19290 [Oligoflexia bacterium]|nr:hypothetical protein [Oligoflexia bacterium]